MAIRNWLPFDRTTAGGRSSVTDIEDAELVPPDESRMPARIGLWGIALGLGGFLLWAGLAPLDEGVPTSGTVSIDTKRKVVQHLRGGIVREVLVKEGQLVHAKDVLFRIDDSNSRAEYETIRQHYLTLRAMESRLKAEQRGERKIMFHEDLAKHLGDPLIQQLVTTQQLLFDSRRGALEAELASIDQSIQANEAQLEGLNGSLVQRQQQAALLQRELDGIRSLVAEGYAPRNRQFELERNLADVSATISDMKGNQIRLQRTVGELQQRALQRRMEFRRDADADLANVLREVQADRDKLSAAEGDLARTEILSPADGQVVGLSIQTIGAVVQPGQKLLDVVPTDESLIIESRVPPNLIDRIRTGTTADVRFASFAHSPQLVVNGAVTSISSDLVSEPGTATSPPVAYYLARVAITADGLKTLGRRQLQAGMPAEVIFKTGERTVLTYLLHPLTKRLAQSMKEE